MARKLKDNCGIVYLFTNNLYRKEGLHKYGVTINPIERKMVQSNSTPPSYPFYDEIIIFSTDYKKIEKTLKKEFVDRNWALHGKGENAGNEWIRHDNFDEIVNVYKLMLDRFPTAEMCYNGKRYVSENGQIVEKKLPNCRLDFLGLRDGDKIKFKNGNQVFIFEIKDNGILVDGKVVTLSSFAEKLLSKPGKANKFNGYRYFTYKNKNLYDEWQALVNCGTTKS